MPSELPTAKAVKTWEVEASALPPYRRARIEAACEEFGVAPAEVLKGGTGAAVVRAVDSHGGSVVVKTTCGTWWYGERELAVELRCLLAWPHGAVRVIEARKDALCLEWLENAGADVETVGLEGLRRSAAALAAARVDAPAGVGDLAARAARSYGWVARRPLLRAHRMAVLSAISRLCDEWGRSSEDARLLHGDLCTRNLAVGDRSVRWFDPLGCAGPLQFDLAYLAWRFSPAVPAWEAFAAALSAAGYDPERELRWFEQLAVFRASSATPDPEAVAVCGWERYVLPSRAVPGDVAA